jgi:hypothetical protein
VYETAPAPATPTLDDEVLVPNQPTGQKAFKDFSRSGRRIAPALSGA